MPKPVPASYEQSPGQWQRSERSLKGVHPDLVKIYRRAVQLSPLDPVVTCGPRTVAEQRILVAKGASRTMNSRHIPGREGLDPDAFWTKTPRLLALIIGAKGRSLERDHNESVWLAWHIVALHRQKKLPKLDALMHRRAAVCDRRRGWRSCVGSISGFGNFRYRRER